MEGFVVAAKRLLKRFHIELDRKLSSFGVCVFFFPGRVLHLFLISIYYIDITIPAKHLTLFYN